MHKLTARLLALLYKSADKLEFPDNSASFIYGSTFETQ